MSLTKIRSGIEPFDMMTGGLYTDRPTLVYGHIGSGRGYLASHFIKHSCDIGESILMLTSVDPETFLLRGRSIGADFSQHLESGQLTIATYDSLGVDTSEHGCLPLPETMVALGKEIKNRSVTRLIFYPVRPWVERYPISEMADQVSLFFDSLATVSATSLLFLPNPTSPPSIALKQALAEKCPIVIHVNGVAAANITLDVQKYDGATTFSEPLEIQMEFVPGQGYRTPATVATASMEDKAPEVSTTQATPKQSATAPQRPNRTRAVSAFMPNIPVVEQSLPSVPAKNAITREQAPTRHRVVSFGSQLPDDSAAVLSRSDRSPLNPATSTFLPKTTRSATGVGFADAFSAMPDGGIFGNASPSASFGAGAMPPTARSANTAGGASHIPSFSAASALDDLLGSSHTSSLGATNVQSASALENAAKTPSESHQPGFADAMSDLGF